MIVPDHRIHVPGNVFEHILQILDWRMSHYNGLFAVIAVVKPVPDPDKVFFLLLFQRHIRIYSRVAEIIVPDAVKQRQIPGIIQPVLQRPGPQLLQLGQGFVPAVDHPLTGSVQKAYIQFIPDFFQRIVIIQHFPLVITHQVNYRFRMLLLQAHRIVEALQRLRPPVNQIPEKDQDILCRIEFNAAHQLF